MPQVLMREPEAPESHLTDGFLEDAKIAARLMALDASLSNRSLVRRIRLLDSTLVMQVFYVRQRIIGNPCLSATMREAALEQVESTIAHLPDFTMPFAAAVRVTTDDRFTG